MMGAEERYQRDPVFRMLVDMLEHQTQEGNYTPTEIREAAMLAQVHYESKTVRPITLDDVTQLRRP